MDFSKKSKEFTLETSEVLEICQELNAGLKKEINSIHKSRRSISWKMAAEKKKLTRIMLVLDDLRACLAVLAKVQ
jgi:hypothetical protein